LDDAIGAYLDQLFITFFDLVEGKLENLQIMVDQSHDGLIRQFESHPLVKCSDDTPFELKRGAFTAKWREDARKNLVDNMVHVNEELLPQRLFYDYVLVFALAGEILENEEEAVGPVLVSTQFLRNLINQVCLVLERVKKCVSQAHAQTLHDEARFVQICQVHDHLQKVLSD
jgi:hypothetical protein